VHNHPGFLPLATGSFLWDRAHGIQDLGTLGGTCTLVTGLNNNGKAVGIYVNDEQIQRGFLWQNGTIQDLGASLGGDFLSPEGINDHGMVAGWSYLAGNAFYHAALWEEVGNITDLGVVSGDDCSFATAINAKSQIVGSSLGDGCTFDDSSNAFLWESGSLYDLNTLIPADASLHLLLALGINDRGEIAGTGLDSAGNRHDFLLVPCVMSTASDCQELFADAHSVTSPNNLFPAGATHITQSTPTRALFSRGLAHQVRGPRLLTGKN
jgi:probable HAF family extracellular repeat protein